MRIDVISEYSKLDRMPLDTYLIPDYNQDSGAMEEAQSAARKACSVIGSLLALLVEKRILSFTEACDIADVSSYGKRLEEVEEPQ